MRLNPALSACALLSGYLGAALAQTPPPVIDSGVISASEPATSVRRQ